jgi:hypothetical protein
LVGQSSEGPHSKDLVHSLKNKIRSARKKPTNVDGNSVDLSSDRMGYRIWIHQKLAPIPK